MTDEKKVKIENRNNDDDKQTLTEILNDDVISVIKSFLPPEVLVNLSRADYIENHSVIKKKIPQCLYDSYIHDTLRHDCSFVFAQILREQFDKFHNWKSFEKGGERHHSYLTYLRDQCCDFGAIKCLQVIDKIANEKGFSTNWYKRRGIIVSNSDKRFKTKI